MSSQHKGHSYKELQTHSRPGTGQSWSAMVSHGQSWSAIDRHWSVLDGQTSIRYWSSINQALLSSLLGSSPNSFLKAIVKLLRLEYPSSIATSFTECSPLSSLSLAVCIRIF